VFDQAEKSTVVGNTAEYAHCIRHFPVAKRKSNLSIGFGAPAVARFVQLFEKGFQLFRVRLPFWTGARVKKLPRNMANICLWAGSLKK